MMAALVAGQRGHRVTLFERDPWPGGQLDLARRVPGKEEFSGLLDWFATSLALAGVRLRLGHAASPADLAGFDEVILATGVRPRDPGITTAPGARVFGYAEVLRGADPGPRVAVLGAGGIGFDVAETLVHQGVSPALDSAAWRTEWGVTAPWQDRGGLAPEGPSPAPAARQVHLLQRKAERPGRGLGKTTGWILRRRLALKGVRMQGGVVYDRIAPEGLWLRRAEGEPPDLLAVDAVVICTGQEPDTTLSGLLAEQGIAHHLIGGAKAATGLDAQRAIAEGARIAALI
jgi:2,4-dienoyl-CoA reductase (NADPH2)